MQVSQGDFEECGKGMQVSPLPHSSKSLRDLHQLFLLLATWTPRSKTTIVVLPTPKFRILVNLQCARHALSRKPGTMEVRKDSALWSWKDHYCWPSEKEVGRTAMAF